MAAGEGKNLSGKTVDGKHAGRENTFQLHYFPEIPLHPTDHRRVIPSAAMKPFGSRFVRDSGSAAAAVSDGGIVARVGSRPHGHGEKSLEDIETEAYIRGFNKGEKAGFEAAGDKIASVQAMLTGAMEELGRLQQRVRHDIEKEVVELALAVAERIVRQELGANRGAIADVVREALKKVEHQQEVVVRVNPADKQFLDPSRLPATDPAGQASPIRFRIEGDDAISRGGCFIETESGDIDARIETQLDIIRAAFTEKLA